MTNGLALPIPPDDYDPSTEPDLSAYERAISQCGMMPDGICDFLGSERCDYHCPVVRLTGELPTFWDDES